MSDEAPKAYEVGRGRPPVHSQFRPGQSGNLRGRPKGSLDTATLLERELNQRVFVTENGRRIKVTKREVMIKQLVNKALTGDVRVVMMLQKLIASIAVASPASSAVDRSAFDSEDDEQTCLNLLERLKESS